VGKRELLYQGWWHFFLGHFDMSRVDNRENLVRDFLKTYPPHRDRSTISLRRPRIDPRISPKERYVLKTPGARANLALQWMRLNHPDAPPREQQPTFAAEQSQLETFEPKGTLLLKPEPAAKKGELPRYVAGSRSSLTAMVHFDEGVFVTLPCRGLDVAGARARDPEHAPTGEAELGGVDRMNASAVSDRPVAPSTTPIPNQLVSRSSHLRLALTGESRIRCRRSASADTNARPVAIPTELASARIILSTASIRCHTTDGDGHVW
jgi:hypothetical protein